MTEIQTNKQTKKWQPGQEFPGAAFWKVSPWLDIQATWRISFRHLPSSDGKKKWFERMHLTYKIFTGSSEMLCYLTSLSPQGSQQQLFLNNCHRSTTVGEIAQNLPTLSKTSRKEALHLGYLPVSYFLLDSETHPDTEPMALSKHDDQ